MRSPAATASMIRRVSALRSAGMVRTLGSRRASGWRGATRSTYSEPKIVAGSTRAVTLAGICSAWSGLSTICARLFPASPLMVTTRPTTRPWYLTLEAGPSESPEVGR